MKDSIANVAIFICLRKKNCLKLKEDILEFFKSV